MEKKQVDIKQVREQRQKKKRRSLAIALLLGLIAILLILILTGNLRRVTSYIGLAKNLYLNPKVSTIDFQLSDKTVAAAIKDTIFIVDESGLTALDEEGKWKWNFPYEYESPILKTYKDLALLINLGGKDIFIFDSQGLLRQIQFDEGLISASYNQESKQLMVIHKEKGFKSCLTVYENAKDGEALFTRKFGSYYMTSVSMSKDGSQLAISGFGEGGGRASAVVSFLKVRDGDLYASLTYEDTLLPYVEYIDKNVVFALSSDKIIRIVKETTASDKYDGDKTIWDRNNDSLALVCANTYNGAYLVAGFSEDNDSYVNEKAFTKIKIFDSKGQSKKEFTIDGKVKGIETNKDSFAIFTENDIYLYTIKGKLISNYNLISDLESVTYLDTRVLLAHGKHQMAILDMSGREK